MVVDVQAAPSRCIVLGDCVERDGVESATMPNDCQRRQGFFWLFIARQVVREIKRRSLASVSPVENIGIRSVEKPISNPLAVFLEKRQDLLNYYR